MRSIAMGVCEGGMACVGSYMAIVQHLHAAGMCSCQPSVAASAQLSAAQRSSAQLRSSVPCVVAQFVQRVCSMAQNRVYVVPRALGPKIVHRAW